MPTRVTLVVVGLALAAVAYIKPPLAPLAAALAEPVRIAGGSFEPSGVIHVPGTNGVLFVDDDTTRDIFWMELSAAGGQTAQAVRVPLGADVTDMEGMTTDGTHFFVVGSQSKLTGYDGDGLVRFRFDPKTRSVSQVERVRGLKAFLAGQVAELRGTERRLGDEVLNIEAIAWDPVRARLLLGLRAPVVDGQTLIVSLKLRQPADPFSSENLQVEGGKALRLPLDGAGVRSLEYDARIKTFRLVTGASLNAEGLDFRLLDWNGEDRAAGLRELMRFPRRLKPEGIAPAVIDGRQTSVLVFDTNRLLLLD